MALHSKWVEGNLQFYDGTLNIFKIPYSTGAVAFGSTGVGCVASAYYAGTTGTVGLDYSSTAGPTVFTIVKGIVTVCST
ncbi:hypothetical protein ES705_39709 [subsurface metagenome]